jgi:hypothetical protein
MSAFPSDGKSVPLAVGRQDTTKPLTGVQFGYTHPMSTLWHECPVAGNSTVAGRLRPDLHVGQRDAETPLVLAARL